MPAMPHLLCLAGAMFWCRGTVCLSCQSVTRTQPSLFLRRVANGIFCCLLLRFSRALQTTNLWFGAEPARRPQIFAAEC
jgi:hypothetical protein